MCLPDLALLLAHAGLPQEGVAALQEAGLWRYAAVLTAHTLKGDERAAALDRWAGHVHQVRVSSSGLHYNWAGHVHQVCPKRMHAQHTLRSP